jgi:hypothetical protein
MPSRTHRAKRTLITGLVSLLAAYVWWWFTTNVIAVANPQLSPTELTVLASWTSTVIGVAAGFAAWTQPEPKKNAGSK